MAATNAKGLDPIKARALMATIEADPSVANDVAAIKKQCAVDVAHKMKKISDIEHNKCTGEMQLNLRLFAAHLAHVEKRETTGAFRPETTWVRAAENRYDVDCSFGIAVIAACGEDAWTQFMCDWNRRVLKAKRAIKILSADNIADEDLQTVLRIAEMPHKEFYGHYTRAMADL